MPATDVAAVVLNVGLPAPECHCGVPDRLRVPDRMAIRHCANHTSNLNFQAGQTFPDMVIVPVGSFDSAGKISIYNGSPGPVHVVVDVAGDILFGGAGPA